MRLAGAPVSPLVVPAPRGRSSVARRARARADEPLPLVHPIYVHLPDAPEEDAAAPRVHARRRRATSCAPSRSSTSRRRPRRARPSCVKAGVVKTQKIAFGEALHDLDAAAAEVATTGGAGLSTDELSDLYLYRAIATARADWNATARRAADRRRARAPTTTTCAPPTLAPARTLNPREMPPQAVADFARAVAEVRQRPRGTLTVARLRRRAGVAGRRRADAGRRRRHASRPRLRRAPDPRRGARAHAGWGAVVAFNRADPGRRHPRARGAGARRRDRRGARAPDGRAVRAGRRAEGRAAARRSALRLVDATGQDATPCWCRPATRRGLIDAAVMRLDEAARRHRAGRGSGRDAAAGRATGDRRRSSRRRRCCWRQPPAQGAASARIRPPGRATTGRC